MVYVVCSYKTQLIVHGKLRVCMVMGLGCSQVSRGRLGVDILMGGCRG